MALQVRAEREPHAVQKLGTESHRANTDAVSPHWLCSITEAAAPNELAQD